MNKLKRILCFLLVLTMLVPYLSTTVEAKAADPTVQDYFKDHFGEHTDLRLGYPSCVFIATTMLVDTSNYSGNGLQAYNDIMYPEYYNMGSKMWNTAFTSIDTTRVYNEGEIATEGKCTYNYLLDTIQLKTMQSRYLSNLYDQPGYMPMVRADGKYATWVNALMNSARVVDSGSDLGVDPSEYLDTSPEFEAFVLNKLANKSQEYSANQNYRLPIASWDDDGNININAAVNVKEAVFDSSTGIVTVVAVDGTEYPASYNWNDPNVYKIVTTYQPSVVPHIQYWDGTSWKNDNSVKTGYVVELGTDDDKEMFLCTPTSYVYREYIKMRGQNHNDVSTTTVGAKGDEVRAKLSKWWYKRMTSAFPRFSDYDNTSTLMRQYFWEDYLIGKGAAESVQSFLGKKYNLEPLLSLGRSFDLEMMYNIARSIHTSGNDSFTIGDQINTTAAFGSGKKEFEDWSIPALINHMQSLIVGTQNWYNVSTLEYCMPYDSTCTAKPLSITLWMAIESLRNGLGYYHASSRTYTTNTEKAAYNAFNEDKFIDFYRLGGEVSYYDAAKKEPCLIVNKVPGYDDAGLWTNLTKVSGQLNKEKNSRVFQYYYWWYRIWYIITTAGNSHTLLSYLTINDTASNSDVLAGRSYNLSYNDSAGTTDVRVSQINYSDLVNVWYGSRDSYVNLGDINGYTHYFNIGPNMENYVKLKWLTGDLGVMETFNPSIVNPKAKLLSLFKGVLSSAGADLSDTVFCNTQKDGDKLSITFETTGNCVVGYKVYGLGAHDYGTLTSGEYELTGGTLVDSDSTETLEVNINGGSDDCHLIYTVLNEGAVDNIQAWTAGRWKSKLTFPIENVSAEMMFVVVPQFVNCASVPVEIEYPGVQATKNVVIQNDLVPIGYSSYFKCSSTGSESNKRVEDITTKVRYGIGTVQSEEGLKLGIGCFSPLEETVDGETTVLKSVTPYITVGEEYEFKTDDVTAVKKDECLNQIGSFSIQGKTCYAFVCNFALETHADVVRDGSKCQSEGTVEDMVLSDGSKYHFMAETEAYLYPQLPEDLQLPFVNSDKKIDSVTVKLNTSSCANSDINLDTNTGLWGSEFRIENGSTGTVTFENLSKQIITGGNLNIENINTKLKDYGVWIDGFKLNDKMSGDILEGKNIKWTIQFVYDGTTSTNLEYEVDTSVVPVIHKWTGAVEGDFESKVTPMADDNDATLKFNTSLSLPEVEEGVKLDAYSGFEVLHTLAPVGDPMQNPEDTTLKVIEAPEGYTVKVSTTEGVGGTAEAKGLTDYSKVTSEIKWSGHIATGKEAGDWSGKDTVIIKTTSVRDKNKYTEVDGGEMKLEGTAKVSWTDKPPLTAHFDKDSLQIGGKANVVISAFEFASFGLSESDLNATNISAETENTSFTLDTSNAKVTVSKDGKADITFNIVATAKGVINIREIVVDIGGKSFVLMYSGTLYETITCPPQLPNPAIITAPMGGRTISIEKGGTTSAFFQIGIGKNNETYTKWLELVTSGKDLDKNASLSVTFSFSTSYVTVTECSSIPTSAHPNLKVTINEGNAITLEWKGTNAELASALTSNQLVAFLTVTFTAPDNFSTGNCIVVGAGNLYCDYQGETKPFTLGGRNEVDLFKSIPGCVPWSMETDVDSPYAVLTATNPDPTLWRWDALSGIPASEKLSITVGADLFKVAMNGMTHALGVPVKDEAVKEANKDGEVGVPASSALMRTLTFKVTFTNWWGDSMSNPCQLNCTSHSLTSGGDSWSITQTVNGSSTPGKNSVDGGEDAEWSWTMAEIPEKTCSKCGVTVPAVAEFEDTGTRPGSTLAECSYCRNGCTTDHGEDPCNCDCDCPSDSTVEPNSKPSPGTQAHDCKWAYSWNCSTKSGSWTYRGPDTQAEDSGVVGSAVESSNGQRWVISGDITNGDESVTTTYQNQELLDRGYTTGYGCQCSNTLNMAHPQSKTETFTLYESVDSVVWKTIDNFCISALSNAEIVSAEDMFTNAYGRKVLTSGLSFSLWRGDDGELTTRCDADDATAYELYGTGRIFFTDFPSPTAEGATLSARYTQSPNVTITFTTVANRNTYKTGVDLNTATIPAKTSEYKYVSVDKNNYNGYDNADGISSANGTHYTDPSNNVTNKLFESSRFVGDYLSSVESRYIAASIINNWMLSNTMDSYRPNFVGDAATVRYNGLYQNIFGWVWSTSNYDVDLFNTTFSNERGSIIRNHLCGATTAKDLANTASEAGMLTTPRDVKLFAGFMGAYAPSDAGAMYGQISGNSTYDLVESLQSGDTPFDGDNGTIFNRKSNINTSAYESVDGEVTLSGQGVVSTTTEYYGEIVDSVDSGVTQTFVTNGSALDSSTTTGEALLDFEGAGVRIEDSTRLTFLGIGIDPTTGNGQIDSPFRVDCNYKCMYSIITNDSHEDVGDVRDMARDSSETCQPARGFDGTINPIVICNPIATNVWVVGNNLGYTDIYKVDESKEDMRIDNGTSFGENYVVIGNTFHVWISDIGVSGDTSSLNTAISSVSWGRGLSGDRTSNTPEEGVNGMGEDLVTTQWIDNRYIEFTFPVSYLSVGGTRVHVPANTMIDLSDVDITSDRSESYGEGKSVGENFAEEFDHYGIGYAFTCELSAKEASGATITVYAERIDDANRQGIMEENNYCDRPNIQATNMVKATTTLDIVGRIGDLTMTDTQDYRFSNLFWNTTDEWLLQDVVKKATLESRVNLRTRYNILMNTATPAYGSILTGNGAYTGLVPERLEFPLQGNINNIEAFQATNLGLGYSAYFGITTVGNYTGYNAPGVEYPKSYEEAVRMGDVDGRTQKLEIMPIYVMYDKDDGKFYDIDLYAGSGVNYTLFYNYENVPANVANALYVSLDDEVERGRYAISDFAKNYSLCFNDLDKSALTEKVYVGTSKHLTLDYNSNIVIGTKYGDSQPYAFDTSSNTYHFSNYTANGDVSTPTAGLQSDADYALNARRWFFNLGIPTSTIAVYPGTYNTPLALTQASEKLQKEHPNGVIVCFVQAVVRGEVWDLAYDVTYVNAERDAAGNIVKSGTTVQLDGKIVDYLNIPVYKNGGTSFVLGSSMLPVFVSDITRTATQDLGSQGTH